MSLVMSYTNSAGVTVPLSSAPYWILDTSTLFDFTLKHNDRSNRVYIFSKQIEEKQMDVAVKCSDNAAFKNAIKALFNCFAYDTETNNPGTLQVGDYQLKCFVYSSKKNGQYNNKTSTIINFGIVPYSNSGWIKNRKYVFDDNIPLDFEYDHDYDMSEVNGIHVVNDGFIDCDFEIEVIAKSDIVGVSVGIGNFIYKVRAVLNTGEHLYINSVTKKIYKIDLDGNVENCFDYRDRENYIFTKIPTGVQNVTKYGDYDLNVTLIQQRSEPEWI